MKTRSYDFSQVKAIIAEHLNQTFPAAAIQVRIGGEVVYQDAFGYIDPETRTRATTLDTKFDLASVSKLFTVTAFMTLVEEERVALDQPVSEILPEFSGRRPIEPYPDPLLPGSFIQVVPPTVTQVDAGAVTFRQLLAHNSGLAAWLPLWRIGKREERRVGALSAPFAYPISTHVVYSDIGLILLGWAMEKITAQSLEQIVHARVSAPLGLQSVGYGPIPCEQAAPTEFYTHQNRRMCGEVHDENAWSLGGVAGHAGVFANVTDVAQLGEMYWRGGKPLLKQETVAEMTRLQSEDGLVRRGLGFALWSNDPTASGNPFSPQAFGHTGFTGTSLWIDPARALVVACLTNRVYYGRGNTEGIVDLRVALHRAICAAVDG